MRQMSLTRTGMRSNCLTALWEQRTSSCKIAIITLLMFQKLANIQSVKWGPAGRNILGISKMHTHQWELHSIQRCAFQTT